MSTEDVKEIVKEKYGNAALRVATGDGNSCYRKSITMLGYRAKLERRSWSHFRQTP